LTTEFFKNRWPQLGFRCHPPRLPVPQFHQRHHRPLRGRRPDRGRLGAGHPHRLRRVARIARQQWRDGNPWCHQPLHRLPGFKSLSCAAELRRG